MINHFVTAPLVRAKGLEPLCTGRRILNPVRLPIPPRSHDMLSIINQESEKGQ